MTKLEIARELAERKDMPLADAIKAVDDHEGCVQERTQCVSPWLGFLRYQGAQGEGRTQPTNWRSYHNTCPQGGKVQSQSLIVKQ